MATDQNTLNEQLRQRFQQLPVPIQKAITSADVQKQLRELADTNKLHIDQWQLLENDVMLTLLGFQPVEELAKNLKDDLDISQEMSESLAKEVSDIVFQPIRIELEKNLEKPAEQAGSQTSQQESSVPPQQQKSAPAVVAPATPPQGAPGKSAVRAPISESYKAGESSSMRKAIHDDPYREPPA